MTTEATNNTKPWMVAHLRDVAAFFEVSYDVVRRKWVKTGMPGKPGAYHLRQIMEWKLGRWRDPTTVADANDVRARRQLALAEKTEQEAEARRLKNAEMQGRLLDRDAVRRSVTTVAVKMRVELTSLGGRVAMIVPAAMKATTKRLVEDTVALSLKGVLDSDICGEAVREMIVETAREIEQEGVSDG